MSAPGEGKPVVRVVEIKNRLGLHARSATLLVKALQGFEAKVTLASDDETVNAKSIMKLLMLAAGRGTRLKVTAIGPDAVAAVDAAKALFESGFGEEE